MAAAPTARAFGFSSTIFCSFQKSRVVVPPQLKHLFRGVT
jgi:hypothetical protein